MALQTKAIKQKMKSVGSIKKITKTMEMISVSKMRRAIASAQASKEYAKSVLSLISHIARQESLRRISHFFSQKKHGRNLVIIISSNKGLCGGYNLNIHKKLASFVKENNDNTDCITIGKHSEKSARRMGLDIVASFVKMSEKSFEQDIEAICQISIEFFMTNKYKNVYLLYTEFIRASDFSPKTIKILPLEQIINPFGGLEMAEDKESLSLSVFEPSEEYILKNALPKLIKAIIYQAYLESVAAEHSARMIAMKTASDNATEIFKELNLSFNHARQDGITKELAEIVGGSSAMDIL